MKDFLSGEVKLLFLRGCDVGCGTSGQQRAMAAADEEKAADKNTIQIQQYSNAAPRSIISAIPSSTIKEIEDKIKCKYVCCYEDLVATRQS